MKFETKNVLRYLADFLSTIWKIFDVYNKKKLMLIILQREY